MKLLDQARSVVIGSGICLGNPSAYGYRHFFVLAPNLTIYDKLIRDFTSNTPKYVFKGIAEFATTVPG